MNAAGKFTGTLRVLSLGVEYPIPDIAKQASSRRMSAAFMTCVNRATLIEPERYRSM